MCGTRWAVGCKPDNASFDVRKMKNKDDAMKRIAWIMMSLVVATCFFPTSLSAQSNALYFPYVVNDDTTSSELILTNMNGVDATVRLIGYFEDGSSRGETSVRVPASGQLVVGSDVFGSMRGWVLGSSSLPGVSGNLRIRSTDGKAQDTGEAANPDTVLVFPFVAQSSGGSTEIALANSAFVTGRVALTLYAGDGSIISTQESSLPPY